MMHQYRKRPLIVEAAQLPWTGGNADTRELRELMRSGSYRINGSYIELCTPEGTMRARPGDWIVRGVKGELYPVRPDIFAATYEIADGAPEALEATVLRQIDALRESCGEIRILDDNEEAPTKFEQVTVICNGFWTDLEDRFFTGETVAECIAKAAAAQIIDDNAHET